MGGIPSDCDAVALQEFLLATLVAKGLAVAGQAPPPIASTWISSDKKFAFAEFRQVSRL